MKARIGVAATAIAMAVASVATAQSGGPSLHIERITARVERLPGEVTLVFAVKFVCGTMNPAANPAELAPGRYFTAINVRNVLIEPVGLTVGVALTNGTRAVVEPVPLPVLDARSGLEIDCAQIVALAKSDQGGQLLKGFAEIRLRIDRSLARAQLRTGVEDLRDVLDVVVVYTATAT